MASIEKDIELIGVILYKCEGTRLRSDSRYPGTYYYAIEFTNSDPLLVKFFLRFLREVLKIDENKLRCELFLYEDQDIKRLEYEWSLLVGLPVSNFHKTIIFKSKLTKFKPNFRNL